MDFRYLQESAATLQELADSPVLRETLSQAEELLYHTLVGGGKILLAGNGGSAADCQHLAGELVVRFRLDRPALAALALTVDTSVLTASLNDFGPDPVFSRQLEALGRPPDLFWAFSTSGNSSNILRAAETARRLGLSILVFTGRQGGQLAQWGDVVFFAPADATSHIQECHIAAGHLLCGLLEERLAPSRQA
ncbi:MAG: SIS domain-containing protein [Planctomycetota bacterium]|jgi:D-sedoheptulose 7-phosphate isomerase|nr:SIS domain-containing protein [Planctomycetota bacterium]